MSICIWRGMKSAGEHPVGGENVNVFCPELVEKEDARSSAVVYYICVACWGLLLFSTHKL